LNSEEDSLATYGHHHMSDWSEEEMAVLRGRWTDETNGMKEYTWLPETNSSSVDWRKHGAVTGVKNQKSCGSCWSFSTTGAMEGAHAIKTGKLLSLSEQQFVDCDKHDGGCNGGLQDRAMTYAEKSPIELEKDYKYTGRDGSCKSSSSKGVVSVKSYKYVANNNPSQLKSAIKKQPVAVSIDANGNKFGNYRSGILTSKDCGNSLDHAVLAVGYGSENGKEYYIVKNSWSTSWGEKGYVRFAIESGKGACGIQSGDNTYPSTN